MVVTTMLYTQLSNVLQFDYSEDEFGGNPYDTMSIFSNDVTENNLLNWDNDTNFTYNEGPYTAMLYTKDDESWESHDTSFCSSTAVNKPLSIGSYESSLSQWQQKTVDQWTSNDTENWVMSVAQEYQLECEGIHRFQDVDGHKLLTMTQAKFNYLEPVCGNTLYQEMQKLKSEQGLHHLDPYDIPGEDLMMQYPIERQEYKHTMEHPICTQDAVEECNPIQPKIKRSPGRPRIPGRRNKKQEKKTGRLWEFIRDLLLKPEYCPSLICWEDHDQGIFRFVHSEKVARLWGTIKENPKMTYEKLSRAMRYYYRSKVLQPVLGRRLVYKFGPTATGWQTPDPNFKNRNSEKCKL